MRCFLIANLFDLGMRWWFTICTNWSEEEQLKTITLVEIVKILYSFRHINTLIRTQIYALLGAACVLCETLGPHTHKHAHTSHAWCTCVHCRWRAEQQSSSAVAAAVRKWKMLIYILLMPINSQYITFTYDEADARELFKIARKWGALNCHLIGIEWYFYEYS